MVWDLRAGARSVVGAGFLGSCGSLALLCTVNHHRHGLQTGWEHMKDRGSDVLQPHPPRCRMSFHIPSPAVVIFSRQRTPVHSACLVLLCWKRLSSYIYAASLSMAYERSHDVTRLVTRFLSSGTGGPYRAHWRHMSPGAVCEAVTSGPPTPSPTSHHHMHDFWGWFMDSGRNSTYSCQLPA